MTRLPAWLAAGLAAAVALGAAGTGASPEVASAVGHAAAGIIGHAITGTTLTAAATHAPAPTAARPPATSGTPAGIRRNCGFASADNDIEVKVTATPYPCPSWVPWLAQVGLNWYEIPASTVAGNNQPGADGRPLWRVCVLSRPVGTAIEVMDTYPDPSAATWLCSNAERGGWTPHSSTVG